MLPAAALTLVLAAAPDGGVAGWPGGCPRGSVALEPGACLAWDAKRLVPGRVVVYLHGLAGTPRAAHPEALAFAEKATRRGFAVVALLGEQGLCDWGGDWEKKYCWPTDLSQLPEVTRLRGRLDAAVAAAARHLGQPPTAPFVAGFSNGGFFTTLLASDSGLDARAFAVFHGGNVTGQRFPAERRRPVLLVMATKDTVQFPKMVALAGLLEASGWAPAVVTRDGVHELTAADVAAALDFFEAQARAGSPAPAGP